MISSIEQHFKLSIYRWPTGEKWWDGYDDGLFDLIVLDEFLGQKKVQELNPILSGDIIPLSRRARGPVTKRDNLPVIIISNQHLNQIYRNLVESEFGRAYLDTLLDRITVVDVPHGCKVRLEFPEPVIEPDPIYHPDEILPVVEYFCGYQSEEFFSEDDTNSIDYSISTKPDLPVFRRPFHPNPYFSGSESEDWGSESEPELTPESDEISENEVFIPSIFDSEARLDSKSLGSP